VGLDSVDAVARAAVAMEVAEAVEVLEAAVVQAESVARAAVPRVKALQVNALK